MVILNQEEPELAGLSPPFITIPSYTDLFSSTVSFLFHAFTLLLPLAEF